MSKCWGNIDGLKKHPPIFASVIAAKNINTDRVTLLYIKSGREGFRNIYLVRDNGESK